MGEATKCWRVVRNPQISNSDRAFFARRIDRLTEKTALKTENRQTPISRQSPTLPHAARYEANGIGTFAEMAEILTPTWNRPPIGTSSPGEAA